ncbi:MAG: type II toxin-antitoxin system VapC family toxin [Cyanobium sp.]
MSDSGFLLDTSVLIWWLAEPARLSSAATSCIADPQNQIYCSVVNLWEIQIKVKLGKLDLDQPLAEIHRWIVDQEGWLLLPVQWPHIRRLNQLPAAHKDPFDRLLIAQAVEETLTLVSVDPLMRDYPVAVLG